MLAVEGADTSTIGGETWMIDGHTLEVSGRRVRLREIDAPEEEQARRNASSESYPCGEESALHERIGGSNVS